MDLSVSKMRFELLVLLLFVGLCCVYGQDGLKEEWRDDKEGNYAIGGDDDGKRNEGGKRNDVIKRDEDGKRDYSGRSDDDDKRDDRDGGEGDRREDRDFYYPCDFEDDIDCIRHYFASSGQCKEVHNYGGKPVYRNRLVAYLPGFNLTLAITRSRIKFIRDRISRFYINKKTGNLIMAVDFEGINVESRYTKFIYQRRGREPIIRADYTNGTFPVTLTAVIPLKKGINFKESRVTAFLTSLPQNIIIGPKVLGSTEPVVIQVNAAIFANLPQAALEIFLTEAPSLYFGYLQKYICDFVIPISS